MRQHVLNIATIFYFVYVVANSTFSTLSSSRLQLKYTQQLLQGHEGEGKPLLWSIAYFYNIIVLYICTCAYTNTRLDY